MKVCKLKPFIYDCRRCIDNWEIFGDIANPNCTTCHYNTTKYEIIDFVYNCLGSYALLLSNGEIKKVSISRITDIHEE